MLFGIKPPKRLSLEGNNKKLQPWHATVPRLWIFFGSSSFGAAYFLFCFDQLSFKPMVRLNTSFSAVLSWSTQK